MKKIILLFALLSTLLNLLIIAQQEEISLAGKVNRFTKVPPPEIYLNKDLLNKTTLTNISVSFSADFPDSAQTAFTYAMNIWREIINTTQDIKIKAIWSDSVSLGGGTLAEANTTAYIKNFLNAPDTNKYYTISLAESKSETNMNQDSSNSNYLLIDSTYWNYDIVIKLNGDIAWYYGTDGNTPAEKYDFVTTTMHEFTHGIGFISSFEYDINTYIGYWGMGNNTDPIKYDDKIKTGYGSFLIYDFNNNTSSLGDALTSDNLFFAGYNAEQMEPNGYPKIFAPFSWMEGSSISHWDENTYPPGNSNSLMTPYTDKAEAIHSPGEITFGLLKDIGWSVSRIVTVTEPNAGTTWKKNETYSIKWSDTENGYLSISLIDLQGNFIEPISTPYSYIGSGNEVLYTVPNNIISGEYRIKFHTLGNPSGPGYGLSFPITINDYPQVAAVTFNPPQGFYQDTINVSLNSNTENAEIHYTTSGGSPDTNSPIYTIPIHVYRSMTIKAIAYKNGFNPSQESEASYTINNSVQDLVFFPKGGNYDFSNNYIYLATNINNGEIRYTINGPEPTMQSTLYTDRGIQLQFNVYNYTIKARVFKNNQPVSDVITEYYHFYDNANDYAKCYFEQYDASNNQYKNYSFWSDDLNDWMNFPQGVVMIELPNNTPYIFRSDTSFKPGTTEKFYKVYAKTIDSLSYKNHSYFTISKDLDSWYIQNAYLNTAYNTTIQTSLEGQNNLTNIFIKDPWVRDDTSDPKGTRNRGAAAVWHSYSSPYQITTGGEHQGVFLHQEIAPNKPYYSVKAESPQTININGRDHKFYFQWWEASPSGSATFQHADHAETPVVFNNAGATVTAVMKGTQLSDNQSAFANNNQRKMIRTANGNLFLTYESMGEVWLEMSTDNGRTWELTNKQEPIDAGKSPSIAYSNYKILLSYQIHGGIPPNDGDIIIKLFDCHDNTLTFEDELIVDEDIGVLGLGPYSKDFYQTIAFNGTNFIVVWSSDYGLQCRAGNCDLYNGNIYWYSNILSVPNTTPSDIKPTITKGVNEFYLAWQSSYDIKFSKLLPASSSIVFSEQYTPSYRSGYMQNTDPSIAFANGTVELAWHGYKKVVGSRGGDKAGTIYNNIVVREKATNNWGQFLVYGNNAFKPSISSNYAEDDYYVTWSEHPAQSKYVVGSNNHINGFLSTSTNYVQSYNINDMKNIQGMSFEDSNSPYEFLTSVDAPPSKDDVNAYYAGREGVVRKDSAEFYFAVGDVLLDGKTVDFKTLPDTLAIDSLTALNNYLETEPIELNSNSDFQYSVIFGVTDDTTAALVLGDNDNINFTVRLIDASSGEVIGSYDNVTFTKNEAGQYKNIAYKVNTEGMSSRTVKLQIRISDNLASPEYGLAKIYSSETLLNKPATEEIPLEGTLAVTKYELAQNYPNPFNPSTTIRFSVPNERGKTANVNLSVYNVLGQRVTELVNKALPSGNYEVKFNASGLSSGVYYYRLRSGNFVETKKMILLK